MKEKHDSRQQDTTKWLMKKMGNGLSKSWSLEEVREMFQDSLFTIKDDGRYTHCLIFHNFSYFSSSPQVN